MKNILLSISTIVTLVSSVQAEFTIGSVPAGAPTGLSSVFTKHIDVLGLHVFAKSNVSNSKVLHCANVLAQWIDNNEDGIPDDALVHQHLVNRYASMLVWANPNQAEGDYDSIPNSTWDNNGFQELFADEMNLGYPSNGQFDWTLEENLHLVTHEGYAQVYPSIWGETNSQMTNTMDAVIAGGWYHYNDPTCDYACKATEYMYWSLTSLLGAQNYSWRIPKIADEWELPTPKLMMLHDSAMVNLLQDPQWSLATILPDGSYTPSALCPADLNGDGTVGVSDILALINAWGQSNSPADLDGSGTVEVGDVLAMMGEWGVCP